MVRPSSTEGDKFITPQRRIGTQPDPRSSSKGPGARLISEAWEKSDPPSERSVTDLVGVLNKVLGILSLG